jgi:hypothetical protein
VDKTSACLNLDNEIAVGIAGANHRSICQFSHADSEKYAQVYRAIRQLVGFAAGNLVVPALRNLPSFREYELGMKSTDEPNRESTPQKVCFTVPFERDPKFVGREDLIAAIDQMFVENRKVALSGIGGVGYVPRFRLLYHEEMTSG